MDLDFEFDEEWLVSMGLGVLGGFISLIVLKFGGVPVTFGVKILSFLGSIVAGTLLSKFILSR